MIDISVVIERKTLYPDLFINVLSNGNDDISKHFKIGIQQKNHDGSIDNKEDFFIRLSEVTNANVPTSIHTKLKHFFSNNSCERLIKKLSEVLIFQLQGKDLMFPVRYLNMMLYVHDDLIKKESVLYDLFAVIMFGHYKKKNGRLVGHYYAYVKNFHGQWYYTNCGRAGACLKDVEIMDLTLPSCLKGATVEKVREDHIEQIGYQKIEKGKPLFLFYRRVPKDSCDGF